MNGCGLTGRTTVFLQLSCPTFPRCGSASTDRVWERFPSWSYVTENAASSPNTEVRQGSALARSAMWWCWCDASETLPPSSTSGIVIMFGFVKTLNFHHTFFFFFFLGGGGTTKNGRNEQKAEVWTCFISASTGSCPRMSGPELGGWFRGWLEKWVQVLLN